MEVARLLGSASQHQQVSGGVGGPESQPFSDEKSREAYSRGCGRWLAQDQP